MGYGSSKCVTDQEWSELLLPQRGMKIELRHIAANPIAQSLMATKASTFGYHYEHKENVGETSCQSDVGINNFQDYWIQSR